ncbi:hypothetical protein SMICM17S_09711 [Streptomyces microflavus]
MRAGRRPREEGLTRGFGRVSLSAARRCTSRRVPGTVVGDGVGLAAVHEVLGGAHPGVVVAGCRPVRVEGEPLAVLVGVERGDQLAGLRVLDGVRLHGVRDVARFTEDLLDPVRHGELFALVHVGSAAVQVEHGGQELCGAVAVGGAVVTEAGDGAGLVVVVPVEAVPAGVAEAGLPAAEAGLEVGELEGAEIEFAGGALVEANVFELEDHVEFAAGGVGEELGVLDGDAGHLADGEQAARVAFEDLAVHFRQVLVDAGAADVVGAAICVPGALVDDAVGEAGGLGDEVDDVHAEAVDPPLQPPAHHGVDRLAQVRVLPVEVGLLAGEEVQVVLAALLVVGPGGAGEEGAPVVGFRARGAGLHAFAGGAPDVPVALAALGAFVAGGGEPGVFVGGVVDDQVHDELHPALVDGAQEPVEVGEGSEERVDVLVVADVVPVVVVRGGVDRGEPQDVDAELGQVVEPFDDALQVADAVRIRVGEAAGVDLVDHRFAPPGIGGTGFDFGHVKPHRDRVNALSYFTGGGGVPSHPRALRVRRWPRPRRRG